MKTKIEKFRRTTPKSRRTNVTIVGPYCDIQSRIEFAPATNLSQAMAA